MAGVSRYLLVVVIVFSLAMPMLVANAEVTCPDGINKAATLDACPANISTKINNPLSDKIDSIPKLIAEILQIVLIVGVPIVALAIIYTGFLFVTAQGNPEKLKTAKSMLKGTLIGAVLLLGSWVIANAIGATIADISSTTK